MSPGCATPFLWKSPGVPKLFHWGPKRRCLRPDTGVGGEFGADNSDSGTMTVLLYCSILNQAAPRWGSSVSLTSCIGTRLEMIGGCSPYQNTLLPIVLDWLQLMVMLYGPGAWGWVAADGDGQAGSI